VKGAEELLELRKPSKKNSGGDRKERRKRKTREKNLSPLFYI
jgi:hypothetical protein